jgi:EAL domain-containing protein (putative c-di-GMP-specific phosphodiesterase class I)
MSTANLADGFHAKHSRMTSAKTAECGTTGGGQIWTLFPPDSCSLLHAVLQLHIIRAMGLTVAIDDFGTGYSSLSYIAKLPVSTLKIDRAFIINLARNLDDLSIVSTMISLAHSLKMEVVAEGAETQEQANLLRLLKCDTLQGFLFSPGVPADQIEQYLREGKSLVE